MERTGTGNRWLNTVVRNKRQSRAITPLAEQVAYQIPEFRFIDAIGAIDATGASSPTKATKHEDKNRTEEQNRGLKV
jgi:hypothetical protein